MRTPEEVVTDMIKFMKNTNDMLTSFKLQMENIKVDIDKINKKLEEYKDNGRIISS